MNEPRRSEPRLYIDENVTIHEGEDAARRLEARAADTAVDPREGVARVDQARWEEAQRYERRTWMQLGRRAASDRNEYHRGRFGGYAALEGMRFRRGIELGCGPFTNLRLILERCRIDEVVLLDPLIRDYARHPFCRYRGGRLGGLLHEHPARFVSYALHPARAIRSKRNDLRVGGWFGRPVTQVASMIESFETKERFDLVVMVNVLEHCRDAHAVFARIDGMIEPGGILVYHDKVYDAGRVRELLSVLYDAGHPLRVDRSVVDSFLESRFEPLLRREHPVHEEFRGVRLEHPELYFIGRKTA